MRFPDLTIADDIPDNHRIWTFRERLTDLGIVKELFDLFWGANIHVVLYKRKRL